MCRRFEGLAQQLGLPTETVAAVFGKAQAVLERRFLEQKATARQVRRSVAAAASAGAAAAAVAVAASAASSTAAAPPL